MSQLEFLTTDPPNAGTPTRLLDGSELTPGEIYLRYNFPIPNAAPPQIAVEIGARLLTLSLDDLDSLPRTDVRMVLECAGNGRTYMNPTPEGTPWAHGGASPVRFSGARLTDVIGDVPDGVLELVFTGADSGVVEPEGTINYQFSLARTDWDAALLATEIAGVPLPHSHGGPIRLVVPGQYAMKSVKWLVSIKGSTGGFTGHFVNKYRYFGMDGQPEGQPVGPILVRSLISAPERGATIPAGPVAIHGSAWSGRGPVTEVHVSIDGAGEWESADLDGSESAYAARAWRFRTHLTTGRHEIVVRAVDSSGDTQPLVPRWNRNGYANNVVHRIEVDAI